MVPFAFSTGLVIHSTLHEFVGFQPMQKRVECSRLQLNSTMAHLRNSLLNQIPILRPVIQNGQQHQICVSSKEIEAIKAADFLMDNDPSGGAWIKFNKPAGAAPEGARGAREGRRRRARA